MKREFIFCLVCFGFFAGSCRKTASSEGVVYSKHNVVVAGARVTISYYPESAAATYTTDNTGHYNVSIGVPKKTTDKITLQVTSDSGSATIYSPQSHQDVYLQ